MGLKEIIINEYLDEYFTKDILKNLNINDFEILGTGQHGSAILNKENNKVYKFTKSNTEFKIAKKQYNIQTQSLPKIYDIGIIDGVKYYVRDLYTPIDDDLMSEIEEELDDFFEFFYSNVKDVRKSETNLDYNFDDKFLNFLNNLKRDLRKLNIKDGFDIEGISLNLYKDNNGEYILVDF